MTDPLKTIFISYRRSVSEFTARAIFLSLRAHDYDAFMDVENIDSGTFDTIILNQIAARAHFLLICTPGTFERCAEPGDWLRHEIERAMAVKRNIVPVLVNNFEFGSVTKYLTGPLADLPRYNGLTMPHDYFDAAMNKLMSRFLKQPLTREIVPAPPDQQAAAEKKVDEAARLPIPTEQELSAEANFQRGFEKQQAGHVGAAIPDYTEAIRLNPRYAIAYLHRGNDYWNVYEPAEALQDYNRSIELKCQELHLAYFGRGAARMGHDRVGALDDFNEAIRLKQDFAEAYSRRGSVRRRQGDIAGAIADYDEALRLKPDNAHTYVERGNIRKEQGNIAGALADYDAAIQLRPNIAVYHYKRGIVRWELGDLAGAEADFNSVIGRTPGLAITYLKRGASRAAQGDLAGAIEDYQKYLNRGGGRTHGDQAEVDQMIKDLKSQFSAS